MSDLKLFLLGSPHFERQGKSLAIRRRKAIALLAYLAVTGEPHSREALATLLWPNYDASRGRAYLRRELAAINKALGAGWLIADREQVIFRSQADFWLDVQQFQQLLSTGNPSTDLAYLINAVSLYRGDFLAGFTLPDAPEFDEWQFFQVEGLRQSLANALTHLVDGLSKQGDFAPAIPYARRWVNLDPLHEPAQRQLMRLYAWKGQHSAALRQYDEVKQLLEKELGSSPEEETTALYEAIKAKQLSLPGQEQGSRRAGEPGSGGAGEQGNREAEEQGDGGEGAFASQFPQGLSVQQRNPLNNLPVPPTAFIGREEELAQISRLLHDEPNCRLLTIVGPGGMGKTRLALQVAADAQNIYQHGVYFVPLTPISEIEFIIPSILEAINLPSVNDVPKDQLFNYLRQKEMLLVLDNFEHLLDGAELLSKILAAAPQVQLLVTSRERLNLPEEWGFDLYGLQVLSPDEATLASLQLNSAAKLFLQSAQRAKATFSPTDEDVLHVVRICQAVGGMPLGLELAAPWVRLMSCQEIAQEIETNLDFLATSMRNVPERHRSLRAVFDHIWQGLSEEEKAVFRRLSVFRGGCLREAAEAVTGASLRVLLQLMDKSLLGTQTERYEIHELLRQYGQEALSALPQEQAQVQQQHSHYYLAWLGRKMADLKGAKIKDALEMITADFGNIKAAWQYATANQNISALGQALEALLLFIEYQGRFQEGSALFQRTIDLLSNLAPPTDEVISRNHQLVLVHLLAGQGWFLTRLGQRVPSHKLLQQGLSLLDGLQPRAEKAFAFAHLWQGAAFFIWHEYDKALRHLQESYWFYQQLDDRWGMGISLLLQGMTIVDHDYCPSEKAASLLAEAITLFAIIGELRIVTYAFDVSGHIVLWQGHYHQAEQYYAQAQQIRQELGDEIGVAYICRSLGHWALAVGRYGEAKAYLEKSLGIHLDLGNRVDYPETLNHLGTTSRLQGNYEKAKAYHHQALALARQSKVTTFIGESLDGLGCLAYDQRDFAKATQYFQESLTLWQEKKIKGRSASTSRHLGHVAVAGGDEQRPTAVKYYWQALSSTLETQMIPVTLDILRGVADLLARDGAVERAIELLALVQDHPASTGETKAKAVSRLVELAADLPAGIVEVAKGRGQALDWQDTAAALLAELIQMGQEAEGPGSKGESAAVISSLQSAQRFVQEKLIATGGMGEVYQGYDTETGQRVAIKRLKPELVAQNPALVKRLIREGEALRQLNHPNIVKILVLIESEDQPLIVMEYVPGGSLRDLLEKDTKLPLDRILNLSLELADALTRAHHLGILHRDLKPANVLLAEDGTPRLTDFGVAYLGHQDTRLTQAGTVLGTTAYLSPEACLGEELDDRSDVWSLGAVLFEMLTGQPPFGDQVITATLMAILNNPLPDLQQLRPDAPTGLVDLINEMLIKDKAQRLDSMRQIAARLEMIQRKL